MSEAYNVQPGDRVLVHTVAGGMGLCFAQLIAARGATVIGTTSTPEKAEIAKALGAAHVILYKQEDVVKRVLELTDGKGADAIFDGVGKDTCAHLPLQRDAHGKTKPDRSQIRERPEDGTEEGHHRWLRHHLRASAAVRLT